MKDKNLKRYGCAHAAAGVEFPGEPSGERPCHFCIRNPGLPEKSKDFKVKKWYNDGDAIMLPMDCYHSVDMLRQIEKWINEKR